MAALSDGLVFAAAFLAARRERRGGSRAGLLERQRRHLRHFLARVLPRAPFYRPWQGKPLYALPIVSKEAMLENFAAMNTRGVALEEALAAALEAERSRDFTPRVDGLTVGLSSGTSGRRGVFLVSDRERARWAGLLLGRMLGKTALRQALSPLAPPLEIAFFLRASSNLYTTLRRRRLAFSFYDLTLPIEVLVAALGERRADILVAPASVLAALAAAVAAGRLTLAPLQVVSVAEVLEADDRQRIEQAFGVPVEQIYQATEGFLGTSCEYGKIHLHEEEILIEQEWLDGSRPDGSRLDGSRLDAGRRFHPVLTDLRRETQLVVRYRLDDVLLLAANPCACGRPTLACEAIEGRADDLLELADAAGRRLPLFPDLLRRAMALAGEGFEDWSIEQHPGGFRATLRLAHGQEEGPAKERVEQEWRRLCQGLGASPPPLEFSPWRAPPLDHKRRRIRRTR